MEIPQSPEELETVHPERALSTRRPSRRHPCGHNGLFGSACRSLGGSVTRCADIDGLFLRVKNLEASDPRGQAADDRERGRK